MIGDQLTIEVGMETGKAYMRNTNTFAWRLRQQRDAMGITQFEMCDRIVQVVRRDEPEFSLSYPAYNKYETGDTATPRLNVLAAIREITGLSLDYLITGIEPDRGPEYATTEATATAEIVEILPHDLRMAVLETARLLQHLDQTLIQTQVEQINFLNRIKALLPEQERIQASSILSKISSSVRR